MKNLYNRLNEIIIMYGKKNIILYFVVTTVFFMLVFSASGAAVEKTESEAIRALRKSVANIERRIYSGDEIKPSDVESAEKQLDELIKAYLSLDEKYPGKTFAQHAFVYVEKKKNLKLIQLFLSAERQEDWKNLREVLRHNFELSNKYDELKEKQLFSRDNFEIFTTQLNNIKHSIGTYYDSVAVKFPRAALYLLMQRPIEISALQRSVLTDNEAIVDYWIHGDEIYVFTTMMDSFFVAHWPMAANELQHQIQELMHPFYHEKDVLNLKFDEQLAHRLYLKLFEPIERKFQHVKVVFIIPDQFLLSFPFELLVIDTTKRKKEHKKILYNHYKDIEYLINKYAISYNFSVAALLPQMSKFRSRRKLGRRLLTMSEPILSQQSRKLLSELGYADSLYLKVSDYSEDEVRRVARLLWHHDILKGAAVTKKYFLENGHQYRWIYLALPGILNDEKPFASGILFSEDFTGNSRTSNFLTVPEVMRSYLKADMLTLSSCQLKPMSLPQHEGVVALPQSFLFAGVRSVVFNLWEVNSISTSQFMSKFYWELKYKRQKNVEALKEAKVASMKDVFDRSGRQISRAHPYFWAAYRLIGNPTISSPSNAPIPPVGIVAIVYVFVFVFSMMITRKTMDGKKTG